MVAHPVEADHEEADEEADDLGFLAPQRIAELARAECDARRAAAAELAAAGDLDGAAPDDQQENEN